MKNLEQITGEICARKFQCMYVAYVDLEALENCSNCDGYNKSCQIYLPVSKTELSIRRGYVNCRFGEGEKEE